MMFVNFFIHADKLTWTALILGALVAASSFKLFFGGQYEEDLTDRTNYEWYKYKVIAWVGISGGFGVLCYYRLPEMFPHFFGK
jgi:hypothetical protein